MKAVAGLPVPIKGFCQLQGGVTLLKINGHHFRLQEIQLAAYSRPQRLI